MAEIKPISNSGWNRSVFIFRLFRNHLVFVIIVGWISSGLKSPRFQKIETVSFSYLLYKAWNRHSFKNKPSWRVLSLGAIKYLPSIKKRHRTRIWSFCDYFELYWDIQNEIEMISSYKNKKNGDSEPQRKDSKREVQLVICRRWDLSPDERR